MGEGRTDRVALVLDASWAWRVGGQLQQEVEAFF